MIAVFTIVDSACRLLRVYRFSEREDVLPRTAVPLFYASQVWEALGCNLATGPIAAMVLHLSIGDTWNHINNVEKKLGVAVSVVFIVVSGA